MPEEADAPRVSISNAFSVLVFIIGLLLSSGATYAAMSSRVAVLETKVITLENESRGQMAKLEVLSSHINQIRTDVAVIKDKVLEGR